MKSIMAIVLAVLLAGCAPVYYAPAPYYPAIQMYTPQPPIYVPSCGWVDQWDAIAYAWRRIQVCR